MAENAALLLGDGCIDIKNCGYDVIRYFVQNLHVLHQKNAVGSKNEKLEGGGGGLNNNIQSVRPYSRVGALECRTTRATSV